MTHLNYQHKQRFKIALVGCGHVALKHLDAFAELASSLELAAICDTDSNRIKRLNLSPEIPSFQCMDDMLQKIQPDIVALATPSALHPRQAIKAARAGCHVVTEKPMATNWRDALTMVNTCEQEQKRLFVVKQMRTQPTLIWLKNLIDQQTLGRIFNVQVNVFWTRPQSYYDEASWRGTTQFDGGALMNQASHYIDLLYWLFGPVAQVHAFGETLARDIEVEDSCVMNLRWQSGMLGAVNISMLAYQKNFESSLTIIAENGTIRLGGASCNQVQFCQYHNQPDDLWAKLDGIHAQSYKGHACFYQQVIDSLVGENHSVSDGREGLRSLELILAAYRSAHQQSVVTLPLDSRFDVYEQEEDGAA